MTAHDKHMKPVVLFIGNSIEVIPSVITGQGEACGGEWGIVLLPRDKRGMLNHIMNGTARVWRNDGVGDAPSAPSKATPSLLTTPPRTGG